MCVGKYNLVSRVNFNRQHLTQLLCKSTLLKVIVSEVSLAAVCGNFLNRENFIYCLTCRLWVHRRQFIYSDGSSHLTLIFSCKYGLSLISLI